MTRTQASKPGKYGTLYRFAIDYADVPGGEYIGTWRTWAYDLEHAVENWHDGNEELGFGTIGEFRPVYE
jgi:hypothetical protein